jgi:hypothetical protein
MARVQDETVNVVDRHPQNPWVSSVVWHHHGAVAVGNCCAYIEANPEATNDALWLKAKAVAAGVFAPRAHAEDPGAASG